MPWGEMTHEQIVAKLKDAGFDTAAINERLKTLDGVASKAEVEALQNSMNETKTTLQNLENMLKTRPSTDTGGSNAGDGGNGNSGNGRTERQGPLTIDPLAFMEDPTKSVRELVNESLAPVTMHTLGVAADMAYNMAKQRLAHFTVFEEEIKKEWDKYPVQSKGNPHTLIENIYNLVRGRHMDEIMTDSSKKEGRYNLVQPGGTTVIRQEGGQSKKPGETLTDEEKAIARKWGISDDDYAQQKAGMKYV